MDRDRRRRWIPAAGIAASVVACALGGVLFAAGSSTVAAGEVLPEQKAYAAKTVDVTSGALVAQAASAAPDVALSCRPDVLRHLASMSVKVNNNKPETGLRGYAKYDLHAGDRIRLSNITYALGWQYAGYEFDGDVTNVAESSDGSSIAFTLGSDDATFTIKTDVRKYTFDLNWKRDGVTFLNNNEQAFATVRLGNETVATDVHDYCVNGVSHGTKFEIDVRPSAQGYQVGGITGSNVYDVKSEALKGYTRFTGYVGGSSTGSSSVYVETKKIPVALDYNPDANRYGANFNRGARVKSLDAYVNGKLVATGVSDWYPTTLLAGDQVALKNITYRDGYEYAGNTPGAGIGAVKVASNGSEISFTMPPNKSSISIDTKAKDLALDYNPDANRYGTNFNRGARVKSLDAYINGTRVATGVSDWYPTTNLHVGDTVELKNVQYRPGYKYASNTPGPGLTGVRVGANGSSFSFTMGAQNSNFSINTTPIDYYLDLNWIRDGVRFGSSNSQAKAKVWVGGKLLGSSYTDFYNMYPCGTEFRMEISANTGYCIGGVTTTNVDGAQTSVNAAKSQATVTGKIGAGTVDVRCDTYTARKVTIVCGGINGSFLSADIFVNTAKVASVKGEANEWTSSSMRAGDKVEVKNVRHKAGYYAGGNAMWGVLDYKESNGCYSFKMDAKDARFVVGACATNYTINIKPDNNAYGTDYSHGARVQSFEWVGRGTGFAGTAAMTVINAGQVVELRNVKYRDGYTYAGNTPGAGLTEVKAASDGSSFSFKMGASNSTFSINTKLKDLSLDFQPDGDAYGKNYSAGARVKSFDAYVNGTRVARNVSDWNPKNLHMGDRIELTNVKYRDGYTRSSWAYPGKSVLQINDSQDKFAFTMGSNNVVLRLNTKIADYSLDFKPDNDAYGKNYSAGARVQSFNAFVNGTRVATGVSDWNPTNLHAGDKIELQGVRYRQGAEYVSYTASKGLTNVVAAGDGSSFSFTMGAANATFSVNTMLLNYSFSVARADDAISSFDVYVNNTVVARNVNKWSSKSMHAFDKIELKNMKFKAGYLYGSYKCSSGRFYTSSFGDDGTSVSFTMLNQNAACTVSATGDLWTMMTRYGQPGLEAYVLAVRSRLQG